MSLTITNTKIIDFYKEHALLNFENMNLLFIKILNKLFLEISPNMDNNFALTLMNELKNVTTSVDKIQIENQNIISLKFMEMKKEYIHDLQIILNNNNTNAIKPLLLEYTQLLQEKTKMVLDDKIGIINQSVNDIRSINNVSIEKQSEIDIKMNQVLKKFDSSNKKGNISEMCTYNLLKSMYSEKQIKLVNTVKETGDIILTRIDKPIILIENKDYKHTVIQKEVDKFIRDINIQKYSGIFISQNSEIANKKPFEINFYGNNVGIYISNVNYDNNIIQIAIDTIDAIKSKMKEIDEVLEESDEEDLNFIITDEQLNIINNEYNLFINQKIKHIKNIKEFSKKLIQDIENISLPTLFNILSENYGTNKTTEWKCTICNTFFGKNKGSLSSHIKAHQRKDIKMEENAELNIN